MRVDQVIDLRDLKTYFPKAKCLKDIFNELQKTVDPNNESEQKIYRKSKSSFVVQFDKGLKIWAKFLFSKSTVKRIL